MVTRLTDSPVYAHLWSRSDLDAVFAERARWQTWLDILAALARAQARVGVIPGGAAEEITRRARVEALDLDLVAERTRSTSHSTLGLIRGLQAMLPEGVADHVYVGATVQDVSDTWFGLVMRETGALAWRELRAIEAVTLDLAQRHRRTVMVGRTHGQPGAPVTFGFKAASWADELRRHLDRLREGRRRWVVGQLGGAVGALAFYEAWDVDPVALRADFCAELGLGDPGMSWLTSRDRVAEFGGVLAGITGTLARIGTEIYELARPEIGELAEPRSGTAVGSITMPHKRNPERSEHLDTLARLARSSAGVLVEGLVGSHERDGRSWKAEWVALPELCELTGTALGIARELLDGLEVHDDAMAANLERHGDRLSSERVLAALTRRMGKHAAQDLLQTVLAGHGDLAAALDTRGLATPDEVAAWSARPAVHTAAAMVDTVVLRGRTARTTETDTWT